MRINCKAEFGGQLKEEVKLNALIAENLQKVEAGMSKDGLMVLDDIQSRIYAIRGVQVMLDSDLAVCYGVEVRRLNEQVKRNKERFPESFCFQLTDDDMDTLKSQIVTSSDGRNLKSQFATSSWGGRRTKPYAFTEQGVAIPLPVLRSDVAEKVHLETVDDFRVKFSENFRVKFNVKGNQLDRMTEMILKLSSGKLLTVKELAEEYGVSVRTIHEDLRRLEELNIITFKGPPKTGTYLLTTYGKALLEDVV